MIVELVTFAPPGADRDAIRFDAREAYEFRTRYRLTPRPRPPWPPASHGAPAVRESVYRARPSRTEDATLAR